MEPSTARTVRPESQILYDAFTASPIGIALETLEGQPLFVNPALCSMLGYSEDEMRGKHCIEFSPAEDAKRDWALFEQLRAGKIDHYQLEKRFFRRDTSLMWGRLRISLFNRESPVVIAMVEDITEEKASEEARFRHAAIVQSSDDAIISKNLDGVILSWNAGAQRIFGYTETEAIGRQITILIPPELLEEEQRLLDRVKAGELIEHHETVRVTKAGKRVDMSISIFATRDSTGAITGFSGIGRDISERKRIERALRRSEDKFSKAFHESPLSLTITSAKDHRYLDVNRTFERLTGWRREEVIGRTPFDIGIWVDSTERIDFVKRLTNDGVVRDLELRYRRKDGVERMGLGSGELIEIENEPCVLAVVADITDRKQAEDALRESESRFRLLADTAPALIWMSNADKLCTYFNKPWLDFTGRSMDAELGNGWAEGVHSEDLQRCLEAYSRAFDRREEFKMEYRLRRHDGEYRWILDMGVPRFASDRCFLGYVGVGIDVTERRRAEELLSGMSRKLIEAQEQERAWIARELHDDINQRLALTAIELEQIEQNPLNSPSERRRRIQELRNRITEVSARIQTLSHELHTSKLEYLGLVAAMRSWCKEFADLQKLEIQFKSHNVTSPAPPEVSLCLFRVLQEALHNAAKHSDVKKMQVEVSERSGEILLTISDLGRGFDIEKAILGNGLGITSMRERVRLVNGTIDIESKPMKGTTVRVRVPVVSERDTELAAG